MSTLPGRSFERKVIELNGYALTYAEAGPPGAKTIVSLPGSAGLEMSTAKDLLSRKYRVIEINPPGWGGATRLTGPMSQEEIGRLLATAVERLVPAGPFHVIGTSMGGGNALWLAYFATQQIAGIILEGSTAPGRPEDMVMAPTKEQLVALRDVTAKTGQFPYPLPPSHPRKTWATPDYVNQQMVNRFAMMCYVETDFSSAPAVARIRDAGIPVLAMLGTADGVLKPSHEETVKSQLPKVRFELIEGAEHDIQNSAPEEFARLCEDFIG
jgi:pimeloyl-ACP methyl ester carboxylesterase